MIMTNGNDIIIYEEKNKERLHTDFFNQNNLSVAGLKDADFVEKYIYSNPNYWFFVENDYSENRG